MTSHTRELPPEIAAHFSEFFPDYEDFEDVLQHQESVYQSLQSNNWSNRASASTSDPISESRENEVQSSRSLSMDSELDEAIAISLQFVVDDFQIASSSESSRNATDSSGTRGHGTTDSHVVAVSQDDVDPDHMTYEQLQSLTDAIGNESKGLSEEMISSLPSQKFKVKSGWFSSKKCKCPECVICFMEYKHGDLLITLPCMHQYHKKCIKRWLEDHKTCPICNNEISL